MIRKSSLDHSHDQWHHRGIARAALTVEADIGAAAADGLVHVEVRIIEIAQVADGNPARIHARILQYVQLFQGGFPRNAGVREDGQIGGQVCLADGTEHTALQRRDVIPGTDFAESARRILIGLPDQRLQ